MTSSSAMESQSWTIKRLLSWTVEYLTKHGVEEPRLSAEILLAHSLGKRRIDLYARFDNEPDQASRDRFKTMIQRAAAHEPIAYLVGRKEFFSLSLQVSPAVLIPRPETELLVECVLEHLTENGLKQPRLWDLGTGSGCLAIALLKQIPGATCLGTDVSSEALDVARRNAEEHGVGDRLELTRVNRFSLDDPEPRRHFFDVVLSNPPYVPAEQWPTLDRCIREHEPRIAVTDEQDGLSFYRSIAAEGPSFLANGGVVAVEVGDDCAMAVRRAMESGGRFRLCHGRRDRTVGRDRVLMFELV